MKIGSNNVAKLYNPKELGELLNISRTSVYRLVETRAIPFHKIKGSLRFAESDVLEYLEKSRVKPISKK